MKASADPKRFDEAVAWMKHRLGQAGYPPEIERLAGALEAEAQALGATAQLDMAAEVWRAAEAAVRDGEAFADFQARISDVIRQRWGVNANPDASRMDMVFRTNVQRAYMAGRVAQYTEPDILRTRPVWKYSAVMDSRTSPICRHCAGTVLPASHPWWARHQPPLHHRCRSTIIALTQRAADAIGVTKKPTALEPDAGFGDTTRPWRPKLSEYPKPLVAKAKVPPKPKKPKPPPKPKLDVQRPTTPGKGTRVGLLPRGMPTGTAAHQVGPRVAEVFGHHLRVDAQPSGEEVKMLAALEKLPPQTLMDLAQAGINFDIRATSKVPNDPSWHYQPSTRNINIDPVQPKPNWRGPNIILHEVGHALDWTALANRYGDPAKNLSDDAAFVREHAAWVKTMHALGPASAEYQRKGYFHTDGFFAPVARNSKALREAFAEAFSLLHEQGPAAVDSFFSRGLREALEAILTREGYR